MNVGKTLAAGLRGGLGPGPFAQVMEYVPWKTVGSIIERHAGNTGVHTLGCADLFRVMAFAQITWRESLRDIEACLQANHAKLFHMGLKDALDAGRCVGPARLAQPWTRATPVMRWRYT